MSTNPTAQAELIYQQAFALHQQGRLPEAKAGYERVVQLQPHNAAVLNLLGIVSLQVNDASAAIDWIGRAVRFDPDNAMAHANRGIAYSMLGEHATAIACFDRAIAIDPESNASPFYHRGNAELQLKRFEAAVRSFDLAIGLESELDADAYVGRGTAEIQLGRHEQAVISFERAMALRPDHALTLHHHGLALANLGRYGEALARYDRAIAAGMGDDALIHRNRGIALCELGRHQAGLESFERAIALQNRDSHAHHGRGVALLALTKFDAAIRSFDAAIALDAGNPHAYNNRGLALAHLKRSREALENFDAALRLNPSFAEAHFNRANLLAEGRIWDAALAGYERAIALKPDLPFLFGQMISARAAVCLWDGLEECLPTLDERIRQGMPVCGPFSLLSLTDSPAVQRRAAEQWVAARCPASQALGPIGTAVGGGRVRLGYFSADFHEHATAYLIAGLFEHHDRSKFHVTAFSFGPDSRGAMRERLIDACDDFIDVRDRSDQEIAQLARKLPLDIAIDLKGYTQDNRAGIFAHRAAPLQVSFLGYPGTMGAPYIDFLVADPIVVPEHSRVHYSEQILYLTGSYQVNDRSRPDRGRQFTRTELGLPPSGFVYCCFNNNYKILPRVFDRWMRILQRVPGSVLWLLEDSAAAAGNLRLEARRRGVAPERLIFAPRTDLADHLSRQRAADLLLDTFPYNAHTTASDALWAGLPVLTHAGESFASRVAASVLTAAGLPELIASSPQEYEDLAVLLASDRRRLENVKARLADGRQVSPLFDIKRYTRDLEAGFARILEGRF